MTTIQQAIAALETLPKTWTLSTDSIGHTCISNELGQVVGYFDPNSGEIDRWDDAEAP